MNHKSIFVILIVLCWEATSTFCQYVEFKTDFSNYERTKQMDYSFRYYVDHPGSGVTLDHWESRQGDYVLGGYGVVDPNGMVRTVHYEIDQNSGFRSFMKMYPQNTTPKLQIIDQRREPIVHQTPVAYVLNSNSNTKL